MSPEAIRDAVRRQPFLPFRMCLSDGRNLVISRPELVFIGGSMTIVGVLRNVDNEFWDEPVTVANRHIVSLEPMVESGAAK